MMTRRTFIRQTSAGGLGLFLWSGLRGPSALLARVVSPSLDSSAIGKYLTPLLVPPAMPRAGKITRRAAKNVDYYEIAVRQFSQQILPADLPPTTVWGYGPAVAQNGPAIFNAPSLTIEAKHG